MNEETVLLTNLKGRKIPFVKKQNEDEIVLTKKSSNAHVIPDKRIVIHTIDLEKLKAFQEIEVNIKPNNKIEQFLSSVSRKMGMKHSR